MDKKTEALGDARRRISENVRRLRKERGLSQEEMAELADFHRTYVSQLERCITNISVDGLERLSFALGVDICDLLAPVAVGSQNKKGDRSGSEKRARRATRYE
jgi:transcriptional regulator with XRE-family HTH domain